MNLKDQLLSKADEFVARTNLSHARLATMAVRDGKFFVRLANGGRLTTDTYEKFMAFLDGPGLDVAPRPLGDRRLLVSKRERQTADA